MFSVHCIFFSYLWTLSNCQHPSCPQCQQSCNTFHYKKLRFNFQNFGSILVQPQLGSCRLHFPCEVPEMRIHITHRFLWVVVSLGPKAVYHTHIHRARENKKKMRCAAGEAPALHSGTGGIHSRSPHSLGKPAPP